MDLGKVPPPVNTRGGCSFGKMLQDLSEENKDHVRGWIASEEWSDQGVVDAIAEHVGVTLSRNMVEAHRNSNCGCAQRGWR